MRAAGALLLGLALVGACAPAPPPRATPRLVVLGVDGLDPTLARRYIDEGRLPALAALAQAGSFLELATSNPPQSPVAWSHVITGRSSAAHGIYDFVHRDPATLAPYLSTARPDPLPPALELAGWRLPLGPAGMSLLRGGVPFWVHLARGGVPAVVTKIPAHFPPSEDGGAHTLSGMGTPDLLGTYGTFQVITDDPTLLARRLAGGLVRPLVRDAAGGRRATLGGPDHPLRAEKLPLELPVRVDVNAAGRAALVRLGGRAVLLGPGQWSGWVPVEFSAGLLGGSLAGMVRLYLKTLRPHLVLYVSPVNLDPLRPAMPISWPRQWSAELANRVGRFYTQGMPEDTKALEAGVLSEADFVDQVRLILDEERDLLWGQLERFSGGLLFHYFSVIDQASHIFYRALDPAAPPDVRRHARVLPDLYASLDALIGELRARLGPDTTLLVMSDHGFAPYRFKVNVNTWLLREGYLALRRPAGPGPLGHIDWSRTQAYALGLNQLFLNLHGREAQGVVRGGQREALIERLTRRLEAWRDPRSGARVVLRAHRVPPGAHPGRAPDLLLGFAAGYRSSDRSATGWPEEAAVTPNEDRWSGDHCMDPDLVPGVLFSSRRLAAGAATLLDLAPTILRFFDLAAPAELEGRSLW